MNSPTRTFEAIVMGGSAGAIDALLTILPALPATLRASVIVALHVQRDRPSLLTQVFGPRCALPVHEAQDNEPLEPGTIVFAPPDYHLLLDTGPRLSLSLDAPLHFSRPAIDFLFESAADLLGQRLIGILLSGANADGAQGLAAIDQAQGLCIVQTPDSASSPTMPRAALSLIPQVPHVLSPAAIAETLNRLHARGLL
ncbi:MAG: chemotaxis protein CheB [Giesbergeria sp.]|nr:chemotaxis protein CheB [Giesbergeria sp.]MBP9785783.1 chemotaxis protein CheB [Giesbergeria sp.]MBP9894709.1 chemotaxis protein CheB [Giesbergeria sp.]